MKKTEAQVVAYIGWKGPFSQIPEAMGELMGWIGQKGYRPTGPISGVYFSDPQQVPPEELLWEIRCPVGGGVSPSEPDAQGVGVKRLEPVEVAATVHKGPYHEVGPTYGILMGWIAQNGYQVAGPPEEIYLNDPSATPPEELLTEIRTPVKRA